MISDVQTKLVKIKNEIRAQKVYSGLTYSQLLLPENTPTASYSGSASLSGSGNTPVTKIRFRFARTDELTDPPMINFAFNATISPTYKEFAESYGFTFNANDLSYIDKESIEGYISELGDGYVDFDVVFNGSLRNKFFSLNYLSVSVSCQAIANVEGSLTVERII